jgi:hypothetical protein
VRRVAGCRRRGGCNGVGNFVEVVVALPGGLRAQTDDYTTEVLRSARLTLPASGYGIAVEEHADQSDQPDLDDVIVPTEEAHPDHRAHAKAGKHVDDDELQRRTEQERKLVQDEQSRPE